MMIGMVCGSPGCQLQRHRELESSDVAIENVPLVKIALYCDNDQVPFVGGNWSFSNRITSLWALSNRWPSASRFRSPALCRRFANVYVAAAAVQIGPVKFQVVINVKPTSLSPGVLG